MAVNFPGVKPGKITKWKVKKGTRVYAGSLLALYESGENQTVQKLKAAGVGTVQELLVPQDQEILPGDPVIKIEGCKHPTVMKDMCAECGADLRREEMGKDKESTSASVAMVASIPELIVSEQEALEIGKSDEERLLKNRKLVLLVDLDQTLIHTTNDTIPANLKDVYHFQLWHGKNLLWYHTKLRPGTERFLKNISKQYELHICTFGVRMYAHTIASYIDPNGNLFSHRILSRDECFSPNSKTANLKALFPRGDSMVAIIDDREDVWNYLPNVIHVKPYLFFVGTADINAPPSLKKDEPAGEKRRSKIVKVPKKRMSPQSTVCNKDDKLNSDRNSKKENTEESNASGDSENKKTVKDSVLSEGTTKEESKEDVGTDSSKQKTVEHKENTVSANGEKTSTDTSVIDAETAEFADNRQEKKQEPCDDSGNTTGPAEEPKQLNEVVAEENKSGGGDAQEDIKEAKDGEESEYEELIEWEDEDDYLLYLEDILHRVHTAFYELYDQMKTTGENKVPSVKKIIPYVRRKVLKGTNILFSGVFPTNTPPEKSRAYTIAQALGATVHAQFVSPDEDSRSQATTHVVAAKLGTVKVNTALKQKGVHVVTPEWLWSCNDRWERVDERLFYLNEKNSRYNVRDSPDVSKMKRGKRKRTDKQSSDKERKKIKAEGMESLADITMEDENKEEDVEEDIADDADEEMEVDKGETSTSVAPRRRVERQFSETLNPLISFSKDDIDNMDKEVEDLLDEPDTDDSDTKEQESLRKKILGKTVEESSSEDSLSGDFPRGWNIKRKHPRKKLPSDEGEEDEDELEGVGGVVDQPHRVFKHSDQSSSSSENSDFDESIGSVDEEMAEAVEREFLNY